MLRLEELVQGRAAPDRRAHLVCHPRAEALHLHPEVERGQRKCPRARLKLAGQRHKEVAGLGRMRVVAQDSGKAMSC